VPSTDLIFDHVYSEQHPLMDAQKQWLADYEAGLGGTAR
jgi:2-oxoisovalerate dehydrogenase E1 component alpha subunit